LKIEMVKGQYAILDALTDALAEREREREREGGREGCAILIRS
jgi:hypothetical protein